MPTKYSAMPLRPFKAPRASEIIYDQIKELIISNHLKPGDRLPPERTLAEMMQRSRPTVREALKMLEKAGFISILPGSSGVIVQQLHAKNLAEPLSNLMEINKVSVEDLAEYRMQNDVAVACWATFRRTDEDLNAIDEHLKEAERIYDAGDYEAFVRLDPQFHGLLAQAAKNGLSRIMTQVLSQLVLDHLIGAIREADREANKALCTNILEQHKNLARVIRCGSEEEATEAMANHIYSFLTTL